VDWPGELIRLLEQQHRQVQQMRVHGAQELQFLDRGLHRRRRRLHRRFDQPGQPGHPQPGIELKQPVQIRAHLPGQQMRHLLEGELTRPGASRPDHLHQRHHARPDHLRRDQILGRQVGVDGLIS
jgi:hypothetical protein